MFIAFTPEVIEEKAKKINLKYNVRNMIIVCIGFLSSMFILNKYMPNLLEDYLNDISFFATFCFLGIIFGTPVWIYLHNYTFDKSIIYKKLLKDVKAGLIYKTIFHKPPINFSYTFNIIAKFFDLKKKLDYESTNPLVNELIGVLSKVYSNVNANYVWETPNGLVGIFYYVVFSGKDAHNNFLSLFRSSVTNNFAEFTITKESFFDKFIKDIEIGDYQFDPLLRVFSLNLSSKEEIIKSIHSIGKDKIIDFFNNGGDKLLVEDQFAYWIKNINVDEIPAIKYSNKEYHACDTGVYLNDKVIDKNIMKFEEFIAHQSLNYKIRHLK